MKNLLQIRASVLLCMRISFPPLFLILTFSGLACAMDGKAQELLNRNVTLQAENIRLKTLLTRIEQQADVKFVYSSGSIRTDQKVTVRAEKKRLSDLLEEVLRPIQLTYRVVGGQIVLTPLTSPADGATLQPEKLTEPAAVTLTGRVTAQQNGEGLPGVNVLLKGSATGTTTGPDGSYALSVPDNLTNATLVFSYIGFVTEEVPVGNRTTIDIALVADVKSLNEVVVVGYGTQKRSDLTGSVTSIKSEEINAFPITNPVQGLQGRAPGVQIIQNSGEPGNNISVRIRGGNSLRGSNEPLYVVDGFPLTGGPEALNPTDIESIEVLKDASATAIYGSRGANGVVIITTRKGRQGKGHIDIDSYYGLQTPIRLIPMLNAREFAYIANERAVNDGAAPYFTPEQLAAFGEGTNWQQELFRTAPIQNHALAFSGGTERMQYSLSGNILGQKGIIQGSDYTKGTVRANVNHHVSDKVSVNFTSVLSRTNRSRLQSDNSHRGDGVLSAVLVAPPTVSPRDENGNYSNTVPYAFSPNVLQNPLALALERNENSQRDYVLANAGVTIEPAKGLSLRISAGIEDNNSRTDFYSTSKLPTTPNGSASVSVFKQTSILNENIITYNRAIGEQHNLSVVGGFTYQSDIRRSLSAAATGFATDVLGNNSLQAGGTPGIPSTSIDEWTLLSFLGRVNYSFRNRYLLTASMRTDGSSRFGRNNKWGYFPSVALAWRIIEEDFLQNAGILSDLKLRTSWGQTGSTALAPYQTLNTLNSYQTIFSNDLAIGFAPGSSLANPDLKWETTTQANIGIDLGILSDRFTLTADYYVKNTSDLLAIVPLPPVMGYLNTTQNIGGIRNSGVELGINANILEGDFHWNVAANISANRNKALRLAGGSDVFGASLSNPLAVPVNIVREGYPVGVFFGFVEDGLDERGQIRFRDLNTDGVINNNDRTIIGDPNPDFVYGFNSTAAFRNFELTFFLQGVQGADIFNFNLSGNANSFSFGENQVKDLYDNRWTPQNPDPNAKYPRISVNTRFRESDRYVEDGSYLRLRNIQLAYNIPAAALGWRWMRNAQVYFSGQNLLTLTRYSWYDPEVNTRGGAASISLGVDQNGYPTAKTVTFGVRLGL